MYAGIILATLAIGCAWVYHRSELYWRDKRYKGLKALVDQKDEHIGIYKRELADLERKYVAEVMRQQTGACQAFLERIDDVQGLDRDALLEELEKAEQAGNKRRVNKLLDELNNRS